MSWKRLIKKATYDGRKPDFKLLKIQKYKENLRRRTRDKISLKGKRCEICGTTDNLTRHHSAYKPNEKVKIYCRKCHSIEDYKEFVKQFTQVLKTNVINPL